MKFVLGLGNPGLRYKYTRHNIGFLWVDLLLKKYPACPERKLRTSEAWNAELFSHRVLLAKPLTFMNNCGIAFADIIKHYNACPEDILVACDDVNLEFGTIRIRKSGSHGGHKGLLSIIEAASTRDFPRMRLGVGPPRNDVDLSGFVLARFEQQERKDIRGFLDEAVCAYETYVRDGIEAAMNIFNRKTRPDAE